MNRALDRDGAPRKSRQFSISAKVSEGQKKDILTRCEELGCTESELVLNGVFGRRSNPVPLTENARAHLAAVHVIRAAFAAGHDIDPNSLVDLITLTRDLIASVRSA